MTALSRRAFLGGIGLAAAAGTLGIAGCSSSPSGGQSKGSASVSVLPGSTPTGWQAVSAEVNKRLEADLGFTLDARFVNWSNYAQQALLKFTAGEKFDTALQALWLNIAQLQQAGALVNVADEIAKYPNLAKQLDARLLTSNTWSGGLWGVPQVNSASRVHGFDYRADLAEKVGAGELSDFDSFERYLYLVKEKGGGVIPYLAASNTTNLTAIPGPSAQFNATSWNDPHTIALSFAGKGVFFLPAKDAATTKSSGVVPFWEDEGVLDAFQRIRKFYQDGIINKDALNLDSSAGSSQFNAGKFASRWTIVDGLGTVQPVLEKAVKGARVEQIAPFTQGLQAKPNQTFQADNLAVLNAKSGDTERALKIQDWLSIKENHDLVAYGIEGKDWEAVGDDQMKTLSEYAFPGYALCWRAKLERKPAGMSQPGEKQWTWAQNYDNFTVDPFASFIPEIKPVEKEAGALTNVITQFAVPLYYGVVDVAPQLDKLKRAAASAGIDKLQGEMQKQADAYLAGKS